METCPGPNAGRNLGHLQDSPGLSTLCAKHRPREPERRAVKPANHAAIFTPPTRRTELGFHDLTIGGRPSTSSFVELSEAECQQLLAQHAAGRVGWEMGPVPWADGVRNLFIEIKPRKVSGRSVRSASPD